MRSLVFCQFGRKTDNICCLGVDHYRGNLCGKDIELKGSYIGLIPMQLVPIGTIVGAGPLHIAKAPTVQA
jgi:hypothetical protein